MTTETREPRLLENVRVIEFGPYLPGPLAGMYLGALGAQVTKIEPPGGDPYRSHGATSTQDGYAYQIVNRDKSVLVHDAKDPKGHSLILEACAGADAFIDGYRPGVCDRLGLGFDDIQRVAPHVIYCSISGFGQDGPRRDEPGHDLTYLALTGILDGSRSPTGEPIRPGVHVSDYLAAAFASMSIAAALAATPRGACYIDLSMTDALMAAQIPQIADVVAPIPRSIGTSPRNRLYRCADDLWLAVAAVEPHYWRLVLSALDLEHLFEESSTSSQLDRGRDDIARAVAEAFLTRTRAFWLSRLEGIVPIAPAVALREALADAHFRSRQVVQRQSDDCGIDVHFPATFRLSQPDE